VSVPRDSVYASALADAAAAERTAERGPSDELLPGVRASLCGDEHRSWHDEDLAKSHSTFKLRPLLMLDTCDEPHQ
jgi:hypothetical protein